MMRVLVILLTYFGSFCLALESPSLGSLRCGANYVKRPTGSCSHEFEKENPMKWICGQLTMMPEITGTNLEASDGLLVTYTNVTGCENPISVRIEDEMIQMLGRGTYKASEAFDLANIKWSALDANCAGKITFSLFRRSNLMDQMTIPIRNQAACDVKGKEMENGNIAFNAGLAESGTTITEDQIKGMEFIKGQLQITGNPKTCPNVQIAMKCWESQRDHDRFRRSFTAAKLEDLAPQLIGMIDLHEDRLSAAEQDGKVDLKIVKKPMDEVKGDACYLYAMLDPSRTCPDRERNDNLLWYQIRSEPSRRKRQASQDDPQRTQCQVVPFYGKGRGAVVIADHKKWMVGGKGFKMITDDQDGMIDQEMAAMVMAKDAKPMCKDQCSSILKRTIKASLEFDDLMNHLSSLNGMIRKAATRFKGVSRMQIYAKTTTVFTDIIRIALGDESLRTKFFWSMKDFINLHKGKKSVKKRQGEKGAGLAAVLKKAMSERVPTEILERIGSIDTSMIEPMLKIYLATPDGKKMIEDMRKEMPEELEKMKAEGLDDERIQKWAEDLKDDSKVQEVIMEILRVIKEDDGRDGIKDDGGLRDMFGSRQKRQLTGGRRPDRRSNPEDANEASDNNDDNKDHDKKMFDVKSLVNGCDKMSGKFFKSEVKSCFCNALWGSRESMCDDMFKNEDVKKEFVDVAKAIMVGNLTGIEHVIMGLQNALMQLDDNTDITFEMMSEVLYESFSEAIYPHVSVSLKTFVMDMTTTLVSKPDQESVKAILDLLNKMREIRNKGLGARCDMNGIRGQPPTIKEFCRAIMASKIAKKLKCQARLDQRDPGASEENCRKENKMIKAIPEIWRKEGSVIFRGSYCPITGGWSWRPIGTCHDLDMSSLDEKCGNDDDEDWSGPGL